MTTTPEVQNHNGQLDDHSAFTPEGGPVVAHSLRPLSRYTTASRSVENLVRKYPLASAGTMLGVGVLIGVAAQRAFRHQPTVREVLMEALSERASKASRAVTDGTASGFRRLSASARRAMR